MISEPFGLNEYLDLNAENKHDRETNLNIVALDDGELVIGEGESDCFHFPQSPTWELSQKISIL